jgi:hypothetical protein
MGYFSNGTEAGYYEARYCNYCAHQKPDTGGCAVWLAHLIHNYDECNKRDSPLHILIPRADDGSNKACEMFIAHGEKH